MGEFGGSYALELCGLEAIKKLKGELETDYRNVAKAIRGSKNELLQRPRAISSSNGTGSARCRLLFPSARPRVWINWAMPPNIWRQEPPPAAMWLIGALFECHEGHPLHNSIAGALNMDVFLKMWATSYGP